ncbi:MAG: hypothetical protein IPM94_14195 [bacterium]|nr:hypothetical protein [bacterium]
MVAVMCRLDVVEDLAPVHPLADGVGQPAQQRQVVARGQQQAVAPAEAVPAAILRATGPAGEWGSSRLPASSAAGLLSARRPSWTASDLRQQGRVEHLFWLTSTLWISSMPRRRPASTLVTSMLLQAAKPAAQFLHGFDHLLPPRAAIYDQLEADGGLVQAHPEYARRG